MSVRKDILGGKSFYSELFNEVIKSQCLICKSHNLDLLSLLLHLYFKSSSFDSCLEHELFHNLESVCHDLGSWSHLLGLSISYRHFP